MENNKTEKKILFFFFGENLNKLNNFCSTFVCKFLYLPFLLITNTIYDALWQFFFVGFLFCCFVGLVLKFGLC